MGQLVVPTYWGELMVPFPSYDHPSPIGSQCTLPWLLKTEFGKGIRQRSSSARQGMGREGRGRVFQLCLPLERLGREYLNRMDIFRLAAGFRWETTSSNWARARISPSGPGRPLASVLVGKSVFLGEALSKVPKFN